MPGITRSSPSPRCRIRYDRPARPRQLAAPLHPPLPTGRLALPLPSLAEGGVLEGLDILGLTLSCLPVARDLRPRKPAERRIERRHVKADPVRLLARGCCQPFASAEYGAAAWDGPGCRSDTGVFQVRPSPRAAARSAATASRHLRQRLFLGFLRSFAANIKVLLRNIY